MEYKQGKQKFIQAWGALGTSWGVNRTMAQIHALLLVSVDPLSTDQIMEELNVSRGNANMNLRQLIDWGMARKELIAGERKEYFVTDKDIWALARQVARERRRREVEPILRLLNELENVKGGRNDERAEFNKVVRDIRDFTEKVDGMVDKFVRSDEHWFYGTLVKLIK